MIRISLFFILFVSYLSATPLIINNDFSTTLYSPNSDVFITKDDSLTIKDIQKVKFEKSKKSIYKKSSNIIWTKIEVFNDSLLRKELFFRNHRETIDYLDVYIFEDNKHIMTYLLGDLRAQSTKEHLSRKSVFAYDFKPRTKYTIYFKYKSISAISNKWEVYTHRKFHIVEGNESIAWGLISGLILAIIIYNTIQFFMTRITAFLYYVLGSISSLIYLLTLHGVTYKLDLGINLYLLTVSNWITSYLFGIFTLLFIISFFIENKRSFIYKFIVAFIALLIVIMCAYTVGFFNHDILFAVSIIDPISILLLFLILVISILQFLKRKDGASFFLIGQFFYICCFIYVVLQTIGITNYEMATWIVLSLGLVVELLFISFALAVKTKAIEKSRQRVKEVLLEESKFINMGKTISYIVHQLKSPISQIGSQIFLLESTLRFDKKNTVSVLEEKLPAIKDSLSYVNEIGQSVGSLFLNPKGKEEFSLTKQIDNLLFLQNESIIQYHIVISKDYEEVTLNSYKGTFSNIFMIILDNAVYELKEKEDCRAITISTKKTSKEAIIIIEDNGKGIKNISQIFDINYSNKGAQGSGVGLALAKALTLERLKGTIQAVNTKTGARFILKIPF